MLPVSLRLAERWAGKGQFSREEAGEYRKALGTYAREVRKRAEEGTLTRAEDYTLGEFSDPAYVAGFLEDLQENWRGLV